MDPILMLHALIMGIVEGLTEFLPVSSTGHLIITGELLNFLDQERRNVFEVAIQLGAILAVVWAYRTRLWAVASTLHQPASQRFVLNLIIAFLPAAILGFLFIHQIKAFLFNPVAVAVALVIGGVIILWVERRPHTIKIQRIEDMTPKDALKIGCAQALALIPGTSRSGATIIGGLWFGFSRIAATEFSFFLAIPTMFIATFYDVYKNHELFSWHDAGLFATGFIAAFISAMLAVKVLLKYIQQHDFTVFAWYRIGFGLFILASWYFDWIHWG